MSAPLTDRLADLAPTAEAFYPHPDSALFPIGSRDAWLCITPKDGTPVESAHWWTVGLYPTAEIADGTEYLDVPDAWIVDFVRFVMAVAS